jgi:hypothetical protein
MSTTLKTQPQTQTGATDVTPLSVSTHEIDDVVFTRFTTEYQTWRSLFEADAHARISQHPDVVLTELRYADEAHPRSPVFVECRRAEAIRCAAILVPKSIGGEKKFGPAWNLKGYRLAGNRFLGEATEEEQQTLLAEVGRVLTSTNADFLLVEDVESSDRLLSMIDGNESGIRLFRPTPAQRRLKIEFPESHDAYWAAFTSKSRCKLRRKVKHFGECRLERIERPDQVAHFLEQAAKISKNSWQRDLLGDRIANDDAELELFAKLAIEGALRSYLLWKGDEAISFSIATQHKGVLMYEETAYDRRFVDTSPGQILLMKILEDLFEHDPPKLFDFGNGDAEYKRTFGNFESESGNIWLLRPGLRSRLIVAYLNGRRRFTQGLRGLLAKTGLLEWVRHKTRRGIT